MPESFSVINPVAYRIPELRNNLPFVNQTRTSPFKKCIDVYVRNLKIFILRLWIAHIQHAFRPSLAFGDLRRFRSVICGNFVR